MGAGQPRVLNPNRNSWIKQNDKMLEIKTYGRYATDRFYEDMLKSLYSETK